MSYRTLDTNDQSSTDLSEDLLYSLQRLRNPTSSAGGAAVVPRLRGGIRVPYVSGFRVVSSVGYGGGTEFVLTWQEPETQSQIDHYVIYSTNLLSNNVQPTQVGTAIKAPATIRVVSSSAGTTVFLIQTVLRNGFANDLAQAPSCTGDTIAPGTSTGDIADHAVTLGKMAQSAQGNLITFNSSSNAAYLSPGAAGSLLSSNGAGASLSYKTPETLALWQARVAVKTADFTVDNTVDVYLIDTTGGNVDVTLPAANTRKSPVIFKRLTAGANTVTLNPNGSETIDGGASAPLAAQYDTLRLLPFDPDGWYII